VTKDKRGNPDITKHSYRTDREEPLTENLNLRVTKAMKEQVQQQSNPPEFCRQAIQKALDELKQSDNQDR
jgi:hypothetical protein